ncbi:hypothetical protein CPC08DRAFT_807053 [Agrocybe pediades]|nr:hypothetical protein CPC08DRAFT_807053 [Agrocybe pediades]
MIDELEELIEEFPGDPNRSRCFTHILNLTAKSIIRRFDVPKNQAGATLTEAEQELSSLAVDIDLEEILSRNVVADAADNTAAMDDDNVEGWIDDRLVLTEAELNELEKSSTPVRLTLAKLRKFAYAVKNSSTLLLPKWYAQVKALKTLSERIMPQDVCTRWNSTFEMLDFAIKYRLAIQAMTADIDHGLQKYELTREQWRIAEHLRDVLKVCPSCYTLI